MFLSSGESFSAVPVSTFLLSEIFLSDVYCRGSNESRTNRTLASVRFVYDLCAN